LIVYPDNPGHLRRLSQIIFDVMRFLVPDSVEFSSELRVGERTNERFISEFELDYSISGCRSVLGVSRLLTEESLVDVLVDIQYNIIEELRIPIPPCPDHAHPLDLACQAETIVFLCPLTGLVKIQTEVTTDGFEQIPFPTT
jgi:hypothetical protein